MWPQADEVILKRSRSAWKKEKSNQSNLKRENDPGGEDALDE